MDSWIAAASTQKRKAYQVACCFYNIYHHALHPLLPAAAGGLIQAMRVIYSPDDFKSWTVKTLAAWQQDGGRTASGEREAFLHALTVASDSRDLRRELIGKPLKPHGPTISSAGCSDQLLDRNSRTTKPSAENSTSSTFAHLPEAGKTRLGYKPDQATWWHNLTDPLKASQMIPRGSSRRIARPSNRPEHRLSVERPWQLAQKSTRRFDETEQAYRKAIEIDPNFAYIYPWNGLGNLLQDHLRRFDEAEQAYRKAIEIDPNIASPWNNLGNLLQDHLRRFDEAEQAYRKAIEIDPNIASPWNNLGNLLQDHLRQFDEAEQAYRKAIEIDPNDASPWNNLGNLLQNHLRRFDEAEQAYRKAIIEIDPNIASPWYNLGNLLKNHLRRFDEAEQAYRKAIEMTRTSPIRGTASATCSKITSRRFDEAEQVTARPSKSTRTSPLRGMSSATCSKITSAASTRQSRPIARPSKST
ncbi:MAG: tetratricopeptide repeat protein [Verrucomicrobiales bacterium]